jgi:HEAT repeat protein
MSIDVEDMIRSFLSAGPEMRQMLLQMLRADPDRPAALRQAIQSEKGDVSAGAALMLAEFDHPQHLEYMAEALQTGNILVADIGARALERHGEAAVSILLNAFPECQPLVQISIVRVLERINSQKAVEPLMCALASTDLPSLRYTIIQTLGVLGDPRATELIRSFEMDPDHHVQERVKEALERLEGSQAKN